MILSVALNPAIDKVCLCDGFSVNGVNKIKQINISAGGKALNVARAIKGLGHGVLVIGVIGGFTGKEIRRLLCQQDIDNDFLEISEESRTCTTIIDNQNKSLTQCNEIGPDIDNKDYRRFFSMYLKALGESETVVASGSLYPNLTSSTYADMVYQATRLGKKIIIDSSGEHLRQAIRQKPYMIKPNWHEARELTGRSLEKIDDVVFEAAALNRDGIELVVISMEASGAIIAYKGDVYHGIAPKVDAVNSVGSGDAMVAGFAVAIGNNYDIKQMIKLGIASGTANAVQYSIASINMDSVQGLVSQVEVIRLK